jgi:hypothetical protein
MELSIYKHTLGSVMSQDRNFLSCWREESPCTIEKRKTEPDFKKNAYSRSLFCPDPQNDPYAKCAAARLHINSKNNFEYESAIIDGPEKFFAKTGLHTKETQETFIREAFQNYKHSKNAGGNVEFDMTDIGIGKVRANTFELPVCFFAHGLQRDFTKDNTKYNYYDFPSICGDKAEETEAFMDKMNFGKKDPARKAAFQWDTLPRVRTTPYPTYSFLYIA